LFTDADLKRLKDKCFAHRNDNDFFTTYYVELSSLITRLEAAERVIGLIEDCIVECDRAIKDWYKTREEAGD